MLASFYYSLTTYNVVSEMRYDSAWQNIDQELIGWTGSSTGRLWITAKYTFGRCATRIKAAALAVAGCC